MNHPKNRAERRRVNKKKYVDKSEREEAVQRRIAQEALETKEALDVLREGKVLAKDEED
jgi:hypothetical protein